MIRRKLKTRRFWVRQSWINYRKLHRIRLRRKNICKKLRNVRVSRNIREKEARMKDKLKKSPKRQKVPRDFRLLSNPAKCAKFFRRLLDMEFSYFTRFGEKKILLDMKEVETVDFAAMIMLNAICDELAQKGCNVGGNSPLCIEAYRFMLDSGFLNNMYDEHNRKMFLPGNSQILEVQKGEDKIKKEDLQAFVALLDKVKDNLGVDKDCDINDYVAILKEICGNSTEWGNIKRKNWTIAAKFEKDKVVFIALDLGQGILGSLNKRVDKQLKDFLFGKNNCQVLEGVFSQYYGSKSKDQNRNQGLPFIKDCNNRSIIKNLCVLSNNVKLDFSDSNNDNIFAPYTKGLIGTLYSWSVDVECLTH